MKNSHEADDPRRRLLIKTLAAGALSAGLPVSYTVAAGILGNKPTQLPVGQSIYRLTGQATVNGKNATRETQINPGDTVQTAPGSELIFVVNSHAMILRGSSHLVIEAGQKKSVGNGAGQNAPGQITPGQITPDKNLSAKPASGFSLITGLRMLTGKLLTVSRNSPMRVNTATATIGIRGTGFYIEADAEQTYFCTCYGTTEVAATNDAASKETIVSKHHDRPVYILKAEASGKNIRPAPMINHTDQELTLIEALVGRTPPFVFVNDAYSAPRREY